MRYPAPSSIGRATSAAEAKPKCVVFVDDEEPILSSLRSLFRHDGYALHLFPRAADAMEFLAANAADVVVSDMRMPEITGIEFLNHVSGNHPEAIRMILSGYEDKAVAVEALAKGLAQQFIMKPWDDHVLKMLVADAIKRKDDASFHALERAIRTLDVMTEPPRFHVRLQKLLASANSSLVDLTREVEKSPPMVAKLLRVANSVYFAVRKPVTDVREAIVFIGTEYLAGLVASLEAFQALTAGVTEDEIIRQIESLWTLSFNRATIARNIAEQWDGFSPATLAFTCSLLQDIGYAFRLRTDPGRFLQYTAEEGRGLMNPMDIERRLFGIPHNQVGAILLDFWNLPHDIVTAVARHHRRSGTDTLLQILQLAEYLEGSKPTAHHDPAIESLAPLWRERLGLPDKSSPVEHEV